MHHKLHCTHYHSIYRKVISNKPAIIYPCIATVSEYITMLTCHRNKKKITQIQNLSGSGQPEMDISHDFYGNYILHMVGGGVKNSSLGRRPISYIPLDSVFPLQGLTQVYCWLDFPTPYLNLHTPQLIAV